MNRDLDSWGIYCRMAAMKVLLVEDEKKISDFVLKGLKEHGYVVELAEDGNDGYLHATTQSYDVVVLDIMLPGRDGLSILKSLRKSGNTVPVILVTARSELDERLEGLNLGADDYLTKPFYLDELVARIQALHRRSSGQSLSLMQVEDLTVNLSTREVMRGGDSVELTTREFNLLEYLMRSPGRVLTRTQILEHVWGYDFDPSTNVVDVCIQRLRKKVDAGQETQLIETVRGAGYRMRKS
ncbi:response regulator transcription factor [Pelagicoccus enzymogenes]|nr:response regulator transcription factor [Pelagicoccus enzymogenes]MDQ8199328.1 response regulator transcription factor [Pelagicoccus enzymogenes]